MVQLCAPYRTFEHSGLQATVGNSQIDWDLLRLALTCPHAITEVKRLLAPGGSTSGRCCQRTEYDCQ